MKLYYYESKTGNFGDDLNKWLWNELCPDFFDDNEDVRFSSIGTIINKGMPKAKHWIVFSSGIGYGYAPQGFADDGWDIVSVRGPLTADILGLPPEKYISDGAALLSMLPQFSPLAAKDRKGVIFIAHHNALDTGRWQDVCASLDIEFVDPTNDSKFVIQKIRHAELVLADAMHAAIIADALRVPWIPLTTSQQINTFKWLDWSSTINIKYKPVVLGSSSLKEYVRDKLLFTYGEKYFVKSLSVKDSIGYFKFQRRIKSRFWWPYYFKLARFLFFKVPNSILTFMGRSFNDYFDQMFIRSASYKLKSALSSSRFLSNDDVFYSNQERLDLALKQVCSKYKESK